ncbi:MAG: hypothetical protein VX574_00615 [Myxococcota bacterium]|nr:hypothetical protein [Myxococcota bacterium]
MGNTSAKAVRKYLAVHAEPESQLSESFAAGLQPYGHVLAIPASGETSELVQALSSIPSSPLGPVLTILVVNAPADAPNWVHRANTQTLRTFAQERSAPRMVSPNAALYEHARGDLLVVDRAKDPNHFPPGQGVGLARKIGGDLALALIASGRVSSPWIHISDADVIFPDDYFQQVPESADPRIGALLYRFRHRPGDDSRSYEAALQYEATLRYYVTGLGFAGSKYAFHSIGSTLALRADAYAQVRGFPRRTAAEDFYLLNKIAKVGRVRSLPGAPLKLSSRVSGRVPFGTGAAIGRMLENPERERGTYHPALFYHLRAWLDTLEAAIAENPLPQDPAATLAEMARERALRDPVADPDRLVAALEVTGALAAAADALAAPRRTVRRRAQDGFDGFRTLKLLHALRDSGLPDLPLREALGRADFLSLPEACENETLEQIVARIERREDELSTAGASPSAQL